MSDAINPPLSQKTRRKRQLLWSYGLIMLAAMAVAGALGIAAGYLENVKDPPAWLIAARDVFNFPWWPAVLMAALLAYALWWSLAYWRQLDELARAAHERAWFWGGSIAMGVALAAISVGAVVSPFREIQLPGWTAMQLIQAGAAGLTIVTLIGYTIAWAIFWWRAR